MAATEIEESFINDAFMSDDIEKMPGDYFIELGEVKKFRNLENFTVLDPDGIYQEIEYSEEIKNGYNYYFEIWDNCHEFGLPNNDWTLNPIWLVNHVKRFNRIYLEIENYRIEKRRK